MQRIVRVAVLVAGIGSLLGAVFFTPLQRRMTYFPSRTLGAAEMVLPGAEEVHFATDDGLELKAWFFPSTLGQSSVTVVVFNGNGGNRGDRGPLARGLASNGYGVLLFDYRGYGTNAGTPSEEGLGADGRAAVTYLTTRSDVDSERLVYFGESLGAAVAIATAGQIPPAALILRSPFTSLPEVASVHFPLVPTSLLLRDRYPNEEAIRTLYVPVLVVAGSEDRTVPLEQSERVFRAAVGPKRMVVIDGADHNDHQLSSGEQVLGAVVEFIDDMMLPRA